MGYNTDFRGQINIDPPLDSDEIAYLIKFSETRRMFRVAGPYFIGGTGFHGQGNDADVIDHNTPPPGQPGLWCQWIPNEDGTALVWNEAEKFYDAEQWMLYLIQHFLSPGAFAIGHVPAIRGGHILNGTIDAQGDNPEDRWQLVVRNNKVFRKDLIYGRPGGHDEIAPYNYSYPLESPSARDYFAEMFGLFPNPLWTEAIVYVDHDTGAPTNVMRVFIGNQEAAQFRIYESGRARREGMLEWMPDEEE